MTGTRMAGDRSATGRRATGSAVSRWYGALDAIAPYLILLVSVAIARHPFASTVPAMFAVIGAAVIVAIGAGVVFFRDMSESHLAWPVALVLFVLLAPFLTLHATLERSALDAPVPVHLLPLVFTWTGTLIASLLIAGYLYTASASYPGWAGILVAPIAALVGSVAATSLDGSRDAALDALLTAFAIAAIAAGVGWLVPDRMRWSLIPAVLTIGALTTARTVFTTPHHLPGRWLFLGDGALAAMIGLIALGSPLICRWLTKQRAMGNEQ